MTRCPRRFSDGSASQPGLLIERGQVADVDRLDVLVKLPPTEDLPASVESFEPPLRASDVLVGTEHDT